MLFNSYSYMLAFLPFAVLIYSASKAINITLSKIVMIIMSLYFYCYLSTTNLPVLLISCFVTYSSYLLMNRYRNRKLVSIVAITINAITLCYFKYIYFIVGYAGIKNAEWTYSLGLPLAVSFFTFQQISFIVDSYKEKVKDVGIIDYLYYISFFPKLIAGPITRYNDLMLQDGIRGSARSYDFLSGLMIFSIGLFKKVVLSGHFALIADHGYMTINALTTVDAWVTSLAYTMQIYFDFSGYSDMAIGTALFFGIHLPINFHSPYKSLNIREFWERWHISLSTWLRDYIYIPLGGSRVNDVRIYMNVIVTFLVSGAWHGSGFNFILWGLLHGVATCISREWSKRGLSMPSIAAWLITFLFINLSWVPFRAISFQDTITMLKKMLMITDEVKNDVSVFNSIKLDYMDVFANHLVFSIEKPYWCIVTLAITMLFIFSKNSNEISGYGKKIKNEINILWVIATGAGLSLSIINMFGGVSASQFIYSAF